MDITYGHSVDCSCPACYNRRAAVAAAVAKPPAKKQLTRDMAEKVADAIFEDLRTRKFLKWLFAEDADSMGPILHERNGEPLMPLSEAIQDEIRSEWIERLMTL